MGRHHDLDIALAHRADDVLDRLGGRGIETRGRLVKKKHRRITRQRAPTPGAAARRRTYGARRGRPALRGRPVRAIQWSVARVRRAELWPREARSECWRWRCGVASPAAETRSRAST